MNLEGDREIVERIVDGTLWYREPNRQEAFSTKIYNETSIVRKNISFDIFKQIGKTAIGKKVDLQYIC